MNKDFNSIAELYAYNESRIIIDTDRYAKSLLMLGDVFPPDRDGLYDRITGRKLMDFGHGGGYWVDAKNRKHDITNIDEFELARGPVYNVDGHCVVRNSKILNRIQVETERPLILKAKEAAAALVADILKDIHSYTFSAKNIPDWKDAVYLDYIDENPRLRNKLRILEKEIDRDLSDVIREYEWHEIWVAKSSQVYMLDIKVDIRIKEWYEHQFKIRDIENERIRENGTEFSGIRCT